MHARRLATALAVLTIAVLAATAQPAAASSHLVNASVHTTDNDFNNGATTNLVVNGTGDSATLELDTSSATDSLDTGAHGDAGINDNGRAGMAIKTRNSPLSSFTVTASSDLSSSNDVWVAYLHSSDGTVIESVTLDSNFQGTFSTTLEANTKYWVTVDANGADYFYTRSSQDAKTYEADAFNVTGSVISGGENTNDPVYNVRTVDYSYQKSPSTANYTSAVHDASDVTEGFADLKFTNASGTVTWQARNSSETTWDTVTSSTYSTTAEHTDTLSGGYDEWRVKIDISSDFTGEAAINAEGLRFDARAPSFDNSSADPPDGATITEDNTEFTINVSDADFSTGQGDEVTATLHVDGDVVGSDTLQSNGMASITHSVGSLGDTTYHWTAQDSYGESATSQTYTITTPSNLTFRSESDPSQLVTGANATATFYLEDGETTVTRTDTDNDGKISLAGLPNTEFVVEVDAENHVSRTVYLKSIYGQQNIYLLSSSEPSVEARFTLDDPTGQFDSETYLYVKKPVNISGNVTYETIHADQFGVEGVTTTLWDGERYYIQIESSDGTVQQIGPYRADASETVTVQPGSPTVPLADWSKGWATGASLNNRTLEYRYSDPESLTSSVTVEIYEKGNKSNQLVPNKTYFEPTNISARETLTANESEGTWVVKFHVDRDGESFTVKEEVSNMADLVPSFNDRWRLFIGLGILFMSSGVFSLLNRGVGAVVTAITGGLLYWTGWLGGATAAAGVVIGIFIAILYNIYTSSGP